MKIPPIHISSSGPRGISFEWDASHLDSRNQQDQLATLAFALRTLQPLLTSVLNIHSVHVDLACSEPYTGEPNGEIPGDPFHFLLTNPAAPAFLNIAPDRVNTRIIESSLHDTASIFSQIDDIISTSPIRCLEEGSFLTWSSLRFQSFSFPLRWPHEGNTLSLDYGPGQKRIEAPLEIISSGKQTGGPGSPDLPMPLEITLGNMGYQIYLSIQLVWSCFYDENHPQKKIMDETYLALQAVGWRLRI